MSDFDPNDRTPLIVAGGTRHAVILDGVVINVILWDGTTEFHPGDGCDLVPIPEDSLIGPGDEVTLAKGNVTLTKRAEPATVEPTVEERLAQLEATVDGAPH